VTNFDQATCEQATLAVGGAAVGLAHSFGFGGEIEGLAQLGRMQHRQRPFVVGIESLRGGGVVHHARLGIDDLLQLAPGGDAFVGKVGGQAQLGHREILCVRILRDEERVVRLAEETRVLAGRDRAVGDHVRIRDECRHLGRAGRELVHHGAVSREERKRITQALVVARRRGTAQRIIACRVVVLHGVMNRPDERDLVHDPGHARQAFTHLDAIRARRDRLVRSANLLRRVRLHVEHVEVTRPAPLEEEDDGPGLCLGTFLKRLGPEQLRERQAQQSQPADLEHLPAREWRGVEAPAGEGLASMGHGAVIANPGSGAIAGYPVHAIGSRWSRVYSFAFRCQRTASRPAALRPGNGARTLRRPSCWPPAATRDRSRSGDSARMLAEANSDEQSFARVPVPWCSLERCPRVAPGSASARSERTTQ
jgi:hypothetical protein